MFIVAVDTSSDLRYIRRLYVYWCVVCLKPICLTASPKIKDCRRSQCKQFALSDRLQRTMRKILRGWEEKGLSRRIGRGKKRGRGVRGEDERGKNKLFLEGEFSIPSLFIADLGGNRWRCLQVIVVYCWRSVCSCWDWLGIVVVIVISVSDVCSVLCIGRL